jgi:hypothetical protein
MSNKEKFGLLRKILRALGLSPEAVDELVQRVVDLLSDGKQEPKEATQFPYFLRDNFLSPAEHSLYLLLLQAVGDWAMVCPKVNLSDLFYAKSKDYSEYRIYTNKIDRKHIDFLLCDPKTVKPILGIELDDESHKRADRKERDRFVEHVFTAAKLPLARIPVRRTYNVGELRIILREKAGLNGEQPEILEAQPEPEPAAAPTCPKCNGQMVLRTAKRGPRQGKQFWGCVNYPRCRGIVNVKHAEGSGG